MPASRILFRWVNNSDQGLPDSREPERRCSPHRISIHLRLESPHHRWSQDCQELLNLPHATPQLGIGAIAPYFNQGTVRPTDSLNTFSHRYATHPNIEYVFPQGCQSWWLGSSIALTFTFWVTRKPLIRCEEYDLISHKFSTFQDFIFNSHVYAVV